MNVVIIDCVAQHSGTSSKKRSWLHSFGLAITPTYEIIVDEQNFR
jgi:hypothetical protein